MKDMSPAPIRSRRTNMSILKKDFMSVVVSDIVAKIEWIQWLYIGKMLDLSR